MTLCVYGEVAIDCLVDGTDVNGIWGGAGLYASLAAAKQGRDVNFLTAYGPDLPKYPISVWNSKGVSFELALFNKKYSIPRYVVTGYRNFEKKVSRPMTAIQLGLNYIPELPDDCEGLLMFPIDHSLPKELCCQAREKNIPIFLDPKPHENSIQEAKELLPYAHILLVNEEEAMLLSGNRDIDEAASSLIKMGANIVIIKQGVRGSLVYQGDGKSEHIPAFHSHAKCTLGSGDVFGGALVATYLKTSDLIYSIRLASCVAANFIENFSIENLPSIKAVERDMERRPVIHISNGRIPTVYLAGPFFSEQENMWVQSVCCQLESTGIKVLSPSRENGILTADASQDDRQRTFQADVELMEKADIIVALLDHDDAGTNFEIGYGYSKGLPVLGLKTSSSPLNNMIRCGCMAIYESVDQLVTEVFKHAP